MMRPALLTARQDPEPWRWTRTTSTRVYRDLDPNDQVPPFTIALNYVANSTDNRANRRCAHGSAYPKLCGSYPRSSDAARQSGQSGKISDFHSMTRRYNLAPYRSRPRYRQQSPSFPHQHLTSLVNHGYQLHRHPSNSLLCSATLRPTIYKLFIHYMPPKLPPSSGAQKQTGSYKLIDVRS